MSLWDSVTAGIGAVASEGSPTIRQQRAVPPASSPPRRLPRRPRPPFRSLPIRPCPPLAANKLWEEVANIVAPPESAGEPEAGASGGARRVRRSCAARAFCASLPRAAACPHPFPFSWSLAYLCAQAWDSGHDAEQHSSGPPEQPRAWPAAPMARGAEPAASPSWPGAGAAGFPAASGAMLQHSGGPAAAGPPVARPPSFYGNGAPTVLGASSAASPGAPPGGVLWGGAGGTGGGGGSGAHDGLPHFSSPGAAASSAQLQLQLHKTSPTAHVSSVAVASLHLLTPLFQVGL